MRAPTRASVRAARRAAALGLLKTFAALMQAEVVSL
jgi:hypothetical protein